jgi:hypothetical protein
METAERLKTGEREGGAREAVDVRERRIDMRLREAVEGDAPGQEKAEELVISPDAARRVDFMRHGLSKQSGF